MNLLINFLAAEPSLDYVVKNTFIHFNEAGKTEEVQPCTVAHQPFSDLTHNRDRSSLEYVQRFLVDSDKERFDRMPLQPRSASEGQIITAEDVELGPLTPRVMVDNAQKRLLALGQSDGEAALGPHTPRIMASEVQIRAAAATAATTSPGGQDRGKSAPGPLTPRMIPELLQTHPPPLHKPASGTSTNSMGRRSELLQTHTGKVPEWAAVNDVELLQREVSEQRVSTQRLQRGEVTGHMATPPILHGAFGLDNVYPGSCAGGSGFGLDNVYPEAVAGGGSGLASSMSMGSVGHMSGTCKPCAWFWKPGSCSKGYMCEYCHLCDPGVFEKRSGQRKQIKRSKPNSLWTAQHKGNLLANGAIQLEQRNWEAFQHADFGGHSSGEPFHGKGSGFYGQQWSHSL